jgi:hypothetical protein
MLKLPGTWWQLGSLFHNFLNFLMQGALENGCSILGAGEPKQREKRKWASYSVFLWQIWKECNRRVFDLNELWVAGLTIEATKGLFGRVYKTTSTLDSPCFW